MQYRSTVATASWSSYEGAQQLQSTLNIVNCLEHKGAKYMPLTHD